MLDLLSSAPSKFKEYDESRLHGLTFSVLKEPNTKLKEDTSVLVDAISFDQNPLGNSSRKCSIRDDYEIVQNSNLNDMFY